MTLLESDAWSVTAWTAVIIAASAFFVAAEFAIMAAKQHRLEARATSYPGRAALRNASEVTLVLAGAQLGITVCTLALGAITKPAVHHGLTPLFELGLPAAAADVVAFLVALVIVTFLHLVVGEMAPKSWAIAHPEESSLLLAVPLRAYMFVARPILAAMNRSANWLVRRAGVEPVDELSSGQDAAGLRQLVEHSASVGALDARYRTSLTKVLTLRDHSVAELIPPNQQLSWVGLAATVADVQEVTRRDRRLRVLVRDGQRTVGVVHIRDTLAEPDLARPAVDFAREPLFLAAQLSLPAALARIRQARTQLAVVRDEQGELGVITLDDLLPGVMPTRLVEE